MESLETNAFVWSGSAGEGVRLGPLLSDQAMKILFMPGAGGDPTFWQPVADRLPAAWQKTLLGWPGLGNQPPAPDVNGWGDLYRTVDERIDGRVAIVAQSMGGVLAMQAALAHPQSVSHLVLTATSGGIDLTPFQPQDWRDEYRRSHPRAPTWVYERPPGHEADLRGLTLDDHSHMFARERPDDVAPLISAHLAQS